jgi:hypothetical protein
MPQKDTLDSAVYTCMLISYRRLSPQFQFSLSGVTLVYLSQWAQDGGPPGWLKKSDPAGVILYVMDGS